MDQKIESMFHRQHSDCQLPNLCSFSSPFSSGLHHTAPDFMNTSAYVISPNGTLPAAAFSGLPCCKANQPSEHRGWFYCFPRFRQAFAPVLNPVPKDRLPLSPNGDVKDGRATDVGFGCAQKRFLVVDQSGDQTTLIFNAGIETPARCSTPLHSKLPNVINNLREPGTTVIDISHTSNGSYMVDKFVEATNEDSGGSEMQEDSEELNALLYSDDDFDYNIDEEETSTGHSPSTMTVNDKEDLLAGEGVASSDRPTKRQKLADGSYDAVSYLNVAGLIRPGGCLDDDAQSCYNGSKNDEVEEESGNFTGNRRSKKEKIRETVSILQSIIPTVKGKDAVVVLDEAIDYLKSLKLKAISLGLNTL